MPIFQIKEKTKSAACRRNQMFDLENKDPSRDKLEEEEQKVEYELVEALPILGLMASVVLIAIFVYLAHT
jgi:hypothetical protein